MREKISPQTFLLVAASLLTPTFAKPPEGSDLRYKPYYESLVTKEGWRCCSISDCRPVTVKSTDGHVMVFIDKKSFGESAPDEWVEVPAESYGTRNDLPDGETVDRPPTGVACWYAMKVRCFDWPLPGG